MATTQFGRLDEIETFYDRYCREDIGELARKYPKDQSSLWVDWMDLFRFDSELADDVIERPKEMRQYFEEVLAQMETGAVDLDNATVRFHNIESHERRVDEVRNDDVDVLRAISGQISKVSAVRPVVNIAGWTCDRCGTLTRIPIDQELIEPAECQGCDRQGPFSFDYSESDVVNHQLLRIKQPPEDATASTQLGGEIDAHVTGDLVGYADAGERAAVPGVLEVDPGDMNDPTLDFHFDAWAIDKRNEDYSRFDVNDYREEVEEYVEERNPFILLAESVAPGIIGGEEIEQETPWGDTHQKYWWVRLGVALSTLFGGWRKPNGDGTYARGSSHTLLIGDPSTGKSSIMNAVSSISPRSAKVSGKNATGPGLTAAAVQDDFGEAQWSLDAGALVKAHKGVACVDEIDKMDAESLDGLHAALEDERLEINKAGIDATLKCETSLLASGNPKDSRFNAYETDQEQINIVGSLLDRFDLVFTFKDEPDEETDRDMARNVIEKRAESGQVAAGEIRADDRTTGDPAIPIDHLRAWVALARQEYQPTFDDERVKERLEEFYVSIRSQSSADDDDSPVPATMRDLEALLRLSEGSARARLSDTVELIDAEMAIALTRISLLDIGYDSETEQFDADIRGGRGSQSQRDKILRIRGLADNLETDESGADEEELIRLAEESGIDDAEHLVEKMLNSRQQELRRTPDGTIRVI